MNDDNVFKDGSCKACKRIYQEKNKSRKKDYDKIYADINKDKLKQIRKLYRDNNKESLLEYHKKYRNNNKDNIALTNAEWRSKNKKHIDKKRVIYQEENKESITRKIHAPCHSLNYITKLFQVDEPLFEEGCITVLCKQCGKRFKPSYNEVRARARAAQGKTGHRECNFYCSDECKELCLVYRARTNHTDPRLRKQKTETDMARLCQTKTLKQIQCDNNNGQSSCEKCGDFIDVELHHTILVSHDPASSVNPAGHMLLCAGCHVKLHRTCA